MYQLLSTTLCPERPRPRDSSGQEPGPGLWSQAALQALLNRVSSVVTRLLSPSNSAYPQEVGCPDLRGRPLSHPWGFSGRVTPSLALRASWNKWWGRAGEPEPAQTLPPSLPLGNRRLCLWLSWRGHLLRGCWPLRHKGPTSPGGKESSKSV